MRKKRIKYNWLFMIHDLDLDDAFEEFKSKHSDISENRLARAFILKIKHIVPYKCNCYLKGQEIPYMEWIKSRSIVEFKLWDSI